MAPRRDRRRLTWKILFIVSLIVCYFSFLTMLSYLRAPAEELCRYETVLTAADFKPMEGAEEHTEIQDDRIDLNNTDQGALSGCQTEINLQDIVKVDISFTTDSELHGSTVHVDFCGEDYDSSEQEKEIFLKRGIYEHDFSLFPGEEHPASTMLRIFSIDTAMSKISELKIGLAVEKDVGWIIRTSFVITVLFGIVAIIGVFRNLKDIDRV